MIGVYHWYVSTNHSFVCMLKIKRLTYYNDLQQVKELKMSLVHPQCYPWSNDVQVRIRTLFPTTLKQTELHVCTGSNLKWLLACGFGQLNISVSQENSQYECHSMALKRLLFLIN